MNYKSLAVTFTALALSACATIHRGSTQTIDVSTYNNSNTAGTHCNLKNAEGSWELGVNKAGEIHRSGDSLEIRCENDTQVGVKYVDPFFSRLHFLGDILAGGCTVSCLTDYYYDAFYEYSPNIFLLMNPK